MSRRLLRPFFNFYNDPFFHQSLIPRTMVPRITIRRLNPEEVQNQDGNNKNLTPHQIFENFFNENGIKNQAQESFFKKHYPEKFQQPSKTESQYDPYKILEIQNNASQEEIKEAYRKLALQYHPKNNSTPQAQAKFEELGKAYQYLLNQKKQQASSELFGGKSLFTDFYKEVDQMFGKNPNATLQAKEANKGQKVQKSNQKSSKQDSKDLGQLYSESSYVENINGQETKYVVEKKYKKDGKLLSVRRQETLKDNGKKQIIETMEDDKEVKKKHYIQDRNNKILEEVK